jgi:hypothetical protein
MIAPALLVVDHWTEKRMVAKQVFQFQLERTTIAAPRSSIGYAPRTLTMAAPSAES